MAIQSVVDPHPSAECKAAFVKWLNLEQLNGRSLAGSLTKLECFIAENAWADAWLYATKVEGEENMGAAESVLDLKAEIADLEARLNVALDQVRWVAKNAIGWDKVQLDADRYRWLREQSWNTAELCVVVDPKASLRLGYDCPSLERLDVLVDAGIVNNNKVSDEKVIN